MSTRTRWRTLTAGLTLVVAGLAPGHSATAAGTATVENHTPAPGETTTAAATAAATARRPLDDRLVAVADQVPELGGLRYDEPTATMQVHLTRPSAEALARARTALAAEFPSVFTPDLHVEATPAAYGFRALYDWYARLSPDVLAHPGVVLTDIDEAANLLRVGVVDDTAAATVRERVARLGVPAAAVQVDRTAAEVPLGLQDAQSQVRGGIQIANTSGGTCTLGFVVRRSGQTGIVTNSHCTETQGGVESTMFWQPFKPASCFVCIPVATEIADPLYQGFPFLCPLGRVCRFSDAAFAKYPADGLSGPGRIARPSAQFDPAAWDDVSTFRIIVDWLDPAVFGFLPSMPPNKVGRTSGWTVSVPLQTCVNVNQTGTNITMLCQYRAAFGGLPGDSGSPVFLRPQGSNDVFLIGILWGSSTFSTIGSIEAELGELDPCETGFSC